MFHIVVLGCVGRVVLLEKEGFSTFNFHLRRLHRKIEKREISGVFWVGKNCSAIALKGYEITDMQFDGQI